MTLIRTAEPAVEPVTLTGMKEYLRVSHGSEDGLITDLIKAAREEVERSTSLALIQQSWRLALDRWPRDNVVLLRKNPVSEVLSVTIFDTDGDGSILAPGCYQLDGSNVPARLYLRSAAQPGRTMNGIEIDFSAGYGMTGVDVPDALKRAMMILVAHWFEFRGAYGAKDQPVSIPNEYLRLVASHRTPRL